MLGLAVSRIFAQTRAHGSAADYAFCRELAARLHRQCDDDPQRITRFRSWIEQGFF